MQIFATKQKKSALKIFRTLQGIHFRFTIAVLPSIYLPGVFIFRLQSFEQLLIEVSQ